MQFKKIIFASACLALSLLTASCNKTRGPKVLSCSQEVFADLGVVKEAVGPVSFVLKVKNTTSGLILPYSAVTRCSCLNAEVERKPVESGEDILVEAVYNPSGMSGKIMEEMQIYYVPDGEYPSAYRYLSILVKAEVKPMFFQAEKELPYDFGMGLRLSHEVLVFNSFREGDKGRFQLKAATTRRRPVDVSFEIPAGLDSVLTCRDLRLIPRSCDTLSFFLNHSHLDLEGLEEGIEIYPIVNGRKCKKPLIFRHFNQL